MLSEFLVANRLVPANVDNMVRLVLQQRQLYADVIDPRSIIDLPNAGLHEIVEHQLRWHQYEVINRLKLLDILIEAPLPNPKIHFDLEMIDAIQSRSHTLVRYRTGLDNSILLAHIAAAFPTSTIAIATATRYQANRLSARLQGIGVKVTLLGPHAEVDIATRVVIGTFDDLVGAECEKRDILIVADARHALGEQSPSTCLMQADSQWRLVGLLPDNVKLSSWENARLTAVFGVVAVDIRRHGLQTQLPQVLPFSFRWYSNAANSIPLDTKGHLHHHVRNRTIAKTAMAIITGRNVPQDDRYGEIRDALINATPLRTIILTGTDAQALHIIRRLPGWQVISNEDDVTALPSSMAWKPRGYIVPINRLRSADMLLDNGLHVVIWAGAGEELPPLPDSWLTRPYGSNRQVLVVDIADVFDGRYTHTTRLRQRAYQAAEWLHPSQDLHRFRIERFLASRPLGGQA